MNNNIEVKFNTESYQDVIDNNNKPAGSSGEQVYLEEMKNFPISKLEQTFEKLYFPAKENAFGSLPAHNAFAKRVVVRDENGENIIVNNFDEIRKMKNKTRIERQISEKKELENNAPTVSDESDYDEIEFD